MTRNFIPLSSIFLLLFSIPVIALDFRSEEDRKIVIAVLNSFSRKCGYVSSIEGAIVERLEAKFRQASADQNEGALDCYSREITKISSSHFVYSKMCKELTQEGLPAREESLMRLFVSTFQYGKGIRIGHSILNECLKEKEKEKYLVELNVGRIESDYLSSRIEKIKSRGLFIRNRTDFR